MQGKKIDYAPYVAKLPVNVWLSGEEIGNLWGFSYKIRTARIKAMCKYGYLKSKGNTTNIRYRVAGIHRERPIPDKKEIKNSLDSLITAASRVGTENEILKTGLLDAKAAIERALKAIT